MFNTGGTCLQPAMSLEVVDFNRSGTVTSLAGLRGLDMNAVDLFGCLEAFDFKSTPHENAQKCELLVETRALVGKTLVSSTDWGIATSRAATRTGAAGGRGLLHCQCGRESDRWCWRRT